MFKKTAAAALAAVILAIAPAANAWEEVCMKMPLWKSWYTGTFYVVYDFPAYLGEIPSAYYDSQEHSSFGLPNALGGSDRVRANGRISSPSIAVNQSKCVDIGHIPNGQPFFVYMEPHIGTAAALCETHKSNPDKFYYQQNRPYRKIWFESWGAVAHPKCKFTHETN